MENKRYVSFPTTPLRNARSEIKTRSQLSCDVNLHDTLPVIEY